MTNLTRDRYTTFWITTKAINRKSFPIKRVSHPSLNTNSSSISPVTPLHSLDVEGDDRREKNDRRQNVTNSFSLERKNAYKRMASNPK